MDFSIKSQQRFKKTAIRRTSASTLEAVAPPTSKQ